MEALATSVTVQYMQTYNALWMQWGRLPQGNDIKRAFREITAYLDSIDEPICVIVDLRENIHMPLKETITGALFGPYNNPKLGMWLVIGENAFAEGVARTLINVTRQDKVAWFKNENEVVAFLAEHCPRHR